VDTIIAIIRAGIVMIIGIIKKPKNTIIMTIDIKIIPINMMTNFSTDPGASWVNLKAITALPLIG
jgi:hypothetical protein